MTFFETICFQICILCFKSVLIILDSSQNMLNCGLRCSSLLRNMSYKFLVVSGSLFSRLKPFELQFKDRGMCV